MSKRRVVVTGLGMLSPCGVTVEESWKAILRGQSGISAITEFDTSEYPTKFAGLVPEFDLENDQVKGVLVGVFSALLYALRTLLLKKHVQRYNGTVIMFHQMFLVSVLLAPFLFYMDLTPIPSQLPYLILLAIITTAIGHTLFVKSLRFFDVSTASIISSLQPIFGIILAYLLLNEVPATNVYYGGIIILFSVVVESLRTKNKK